MTSPIAGIDKWAAGIRYRMANDPGRQDLEDHILCNGFLFLDEYLEDILIGARSEPIIELTKTPGRRKDTSKKDRVATTTSVATLQNSDKENVPLLQSPVRTNKSPTSFQKALLKASRDKQPNSSSQISDDFKPEPPHFDDIAAKYTDNEEEKEEEETVAVLVTPPSTHVATCPKSRESTLLPSFTANILPKPSDKDFGSHNPSISDPGVELLASVPVLPSLPCPSPLHKSTRDSVFGGPSAGNARSSATTGTFTGTRSSWLNKARDVTAKRVSVVSGVKRKSGDLNAETDHTITMDAYAKATKIAKTQANGGVSDALAGAERPQKKLTIQPFKPIVPPKRQEPQETVAHVATPDENSEGMMNILKRTVEGLGARVGKSMGKSLGGAAAAAAAAEAKAAAEARLAQREAKGSDGTRQGRLSVSDLVGSFENGGGGKDNGREHSDSKLKAPPSPPTPPAPDVTPGSRASISTTPPDSPPAARSQPPLTLGHAIQSIPKFEVQRPITEEPSFGLPESQQSQPSTQSTYISSIFDNSTWPRSSLGTDYTASQQFTQPKDITEPVDNLVGAFENGGESKVNELESSDHELKAAPSPPPPAPPAPALSGSKRGKLEPVKSIQLAAAAAKKQQEEADRKAARLREMDKRRAAIASKKADQDAAEKNKLQGDRHKREREEAPERNAKTTAKKVDEEVSKKRKVVVEIEKKPPNKTGLKDKKELGSSRIGKPILNTSLSQSQLASSSLSKTFKPPGLPASASQPSVKLVGSNQGEPKPVALPKAGGPNKLDDVRQPSQTLHAQMQARVQVQLLQARQEEPIIPSESIELPDINSEYSNSDDEDRPRTFDPPDWAQSPVLGLALQSQSRLNPDDIFGPVRPLRMEEIFSTRHSRFRARTSSANWAGADELTTDEQQQYAKRMGYLD